MHQPSKTFEEHIGILAAESPCALVLEWGRRLEFAVKNIGRVLGVHKGSWKRCMEALLSDPLVGEEVSSEVKRLRNMRNKVAHEPPKSIASDEAIQFARTAEEIVWFLGRAEDIKAGRRF
jgi:hypothetical protein